VIPANAQTARTTKDKFILIDADIILHRFGHANQTKIQWSEGEEPSLAVNPISEVLNEVDSFIGSLVEKLGGEPFLCFSGEKNFRYEVLSTYKHNRSAMVKPIHFHAIGDHLKNNYDWLAQKQLEGDDLMGIISTSEPGRYIIASIDHDMMQIPGVHYNWNSGRKARQSKADAERVFYMQVLTGDPGDGYKGIPGVGPVKAAKILDTEINENQDDPCTTEWERIVHAYQEAGLTEDDALQQARVARILRKGDYDFDTEEVTLWNPERG
jgi:DNA polymerase-1